jgi:TPR repeat protein
VSDDRPMFLRLNAAILLSIVCLAVPAWADNQAGLNAYVRGDYATALREWRSFAEQGDASAQFYLGVLYGRGVPQDYAIARQWYKKAAAQGHAEAQFNLGVLYDSGQGVPQDYAIARQWYEKAAAQGGAKAQFYLGLLYAYGEGGPQDLVQAHMWYSLAAGNGYETATGYRNDLAKQMTPAQIAEAQKLAREWKPKTP